MLDMAGEVVVVVVAGVLVPSVQPWVEEWEREGAAGEEEEGQECVSTYCLSCS